jgi:hypothetical protein
MIFNYTDFILESLIIESNVIYSDKFRKALSKIDSAVSKSLIDIENKNLDVQSNFFDININKNDTVSFIPDRKSKQLLDDEREYVRYSGAAGWLKHKDSNSEIFNKLGYTPSGEPYSPTSIDIGEVIKKIVSETSGKTYVWVKFKNSDGEELGEGVYNSEKLFQIQNPRLKELWTKGRQEIKIGRAVRALLKTAGVDFVDKDIEDFVNKYKSTIDIMNDKFRLFEIVEGEDIGYWYNKENYLKEQGTIGSSCMKSVPISYFSIYMENPDVCKLVILKSEDNEYKIVGRALLWTLTDGKKFLDRIYTINESDVQLFRDWAKENGIYSKIANNSSNSAKVYDLEGNSINLNQLEVQIRKGEYNNYPYLDTLKYLNIDKGILSTKKGSEDYTLESTGGDYINCEGCDGSGRTTCPDCDGNGDMECFRCDGSGTEDCRDCDGRGSIDCSDCDGRGEIEDSDGNSEECGGCYGEGTIECTECSSGSVDCRYCGGESRISCNSCDSEGVVDCPECG